MGISGHMRFFRSLAALFALAAFSAGFAGAQTPQPTPLGPRAALERLLHAEHASADWFAPSFLAVASVDRIDAVIAQLRADGGAFARVEMRGDAYYSVFEKGASRTQVALDGQGRFTTLFFAPFGPLPPAVTTPLPLVATTLDEALQQLRAQGGDLGYLVLANSTQLAALQPDRPMAVGSTFKLAVLVALRAEIEAKRREWSDVVPLPAAAKSLPSGLLRLWPDGTPITLATYAGEMISISDNTAADTLIGVVGRGPLEKLAPRNEPFLTTRETFVLKADAALREAYRTASPKERRNLLARIDSQPLPTPSQVDLDPSFLDIEWYFTPRELCALMARVADLPLMTINPGVAKPAAWKRVAFKGGSDAGVLNLTTYLTAKNGTSYCVTATWNNPKAQIDEPAAESAYAALLDFLSTR
jgi:beta-lactamase class A